MTDDTWLRTSIMAKRGLAKGQAGKRHALTIAGQGPFHYVYGPYAKSVLAIDPGDVVAVETEDAFGGVITSEQDSPTGKPLTRAQGTVKAGCPDTSNEQVLACMLSATSIAVPSGASAGGIGVAVKGMVGIASTSNFSSASS